jgi:hypothetical protein
MSSFRYLLFRILPSKHTDHQLLFGNIQLHPRLPPGVYPPKLRFAAFAFSALASFLNGGIPAPYVDIRLFQPNLQQHNSNFSASAGIRYLAFAEHIWGHGRDNVLQAE